MDVKNVENMLLKDYNGKDVDFLVNDGKIWIDAFSIARGLGTNEEEIIQFYENNKDLLETHSCRMDYMHSRHGWDDSRMFDRVGLTYLCLKAIDLIEASKFHVWALKKMDEIENVIFSYEKPKVNDLIQQCKLILEKIESVEKQEVNLRSVGRFKKNDVWHYPIFEEGIIFECTEKNGILYPFSNAEMLRRVRDRISKCETIEEAREYLFDEITKTLRNEKKFCLIDRNTIQADFEQEKIFKPVKNVSKWLEKSIDPDVYFIQGEDGSIKIGVSHTPKERIKSIQQATPYKLTLLTTILNGGRKKEAELKERFHKYNMKGEWFEDSPEILGYINNLEIRKEIKGIVARLTRYSGEIEELYSKSMDIMGGLSNIKRLREGKIFSETIEEINKYKELTSDYLIFLKKCTSQWNEEKKRLDLMKY